MAVSAAPSSPPVQDSATAMVSPASMSPSPSAAASGNALPSAGTWSRTSRPGAPMAVIARPAGPSKREMESGAGASPVVGELQRYLEIEVTQLLDHRLQLVLVLA